MNSQMNGSRRIDLTSCALAIALAAFISPVAMSDNGKNGKPDKSCDAGTIRGAYGIQMEGISPVPIKTGGN